MRLEIFLKKFFLWKNKYSWIIHPYSSIFGTLCNACICRNLVYLESWNIQNLSVTGSLLIFIMVIFTETGILCNPENSEPWYIDNPGILRTLKFKNQHIFRPCQRFNVEYFAKTVKNYNCFSKVLYLRSLAGFLICSFLNKHSSTCSLTLHCALYERYLKPFLLS